ncbi:Spx/MgsR family RNA polymerase-binding regulatory protein [Paenibacillus apiarius]|uniref:Spx/MgsR family RNA polymerase-binding regulatory protein n=1 Tax=Paenibacillus apiarius TaxID=46240 RepID=A0ABT4DRD0_9BACL|nr:Spx/MgsR family RNA polymerase-binding regulatory protein [Paenibacillus apiarius]MCY9516678.1 Spx/MgsR family RNA polymerase-binding regulatory protein [Paenibacillus apiarius]MCY9519924.1 Spx/MgsR family RNA polymerase-binding regulatory protein [Paenibacillus apiarius]MCY9553838.1 Spx/MgsR family RNA polymerase-binding regulatory protein [Paenibacillus apiarius]MCY9557554.1 Spx/MgsR family RNA polymerase-binding regulatory protein [Paenibacillus apiarius]MCY9685514.1 Spx/MgsR family RNA 
MKLTVYEYSKCSTCRKAVKWLQAQGIETELIPLIEQPPTAAELKKLVEMSGLELKKWFNTSGEVYKSMQLKDKLPQLSEEEQLELLSSNGKLIKRPIVTDGKRATVGFREEMFENTWTAASKH